MKRILVFALLSLSAISANAAETGVEEVIITIKDHVFTPSEITVPAGKKVKLLIDNQDATPEEFESKDLHREKIIKGNSKGTVLVGPLKPGEYKFVGEFNEKTAKGVIKAE